MNYNIKYINDLATIRKLLNSYVIHSYRSKDEISEMLKKSSKTIYNNDQIFKDLLGDESLKTNGNKTIIKIDSNRMNVDLNQLSLIYKIHSYTQEEMVLYFLILQLLNERSYTFEDLACKVSELCVDAINNSRIKHCLEKEMLPYGIIHIDNDVISLSDTIFDIIGEEKEAVKSRLTELYYACGLYECHSVLNVAGSYLCDIISGALINDFVEYKDGGFVDNRGLSDVHKVFIFQKNYQNNMLNNDIAFVLIDAIKNRHIISITYDDNSSIPEIIPLRIISEFMSGRQFIAGITNDNEVIIRRIDRIDSVKIKDADFVPDIAVFNEKMSGVWCSSQPDNGKLHGEISMEIYADSELDKMLIEAANLGTATEFENDYYQFTAESSDIREIVPWIRSFGKAAVIDSNNTNKELYEYIKKDWEKALKNYGQ